jgi:hypothetical protein
MSPILRQPVLTNAARPDSRPRVSDVCETDEAESKRVWK